MKVKIVLKNEGPKYNIIGDHQQFKLTGKDTNGLYLSILQNNSPGLELPMHMHENEDEVYKVLEGEMEFNVGGKTSLLKGGDMIFLPRRIPHSVKVMGTTNAISYLEIFPAGLENMFEELDQLHSDPPELSKVVEICGRYGVVFI